MWKKARCFFLGLLMICVSLPAWADWRSLRPGLDYEKEEAHLFRIDPKKFRIDILLASDSQAAALTADRYRERSGAVFVINGGFFDETFRSLGLLQRHGETINPLRKTNWGIFLLGGKEGREPKIILPKQWRPDGVSMAIQVGPRLVVDGKIPSFKESTPSRRSAIGISPEGAVVIALSESPLMLREWATLLQKYCVQALNLDGGGSSQLSAKLPNFSLKVEGATGVTNAIAVFP